MKVRCPACREFVKWENNPSRPFCSQECRDHDLGNWATERYRVPVEEESPSNETTPRGEEESGRDGKKK